MLQNSNGCFLYQLQTQPGHYLNAFQIGLAIVFVTKTPGSRNLLALGPREEARREGCLGGGVYHGVQSFVINYRLVVSHHSSGIA